ncbi:hypothetical protein HHX47_DHR8000375 [Lentinula edodes]|nr:hypothetical protein HHX47_DHR8000375 [Lentinula edodes]
MAANTIVFYDIPFAESNICWSPNTWKTRYSLNYKGLSYRTEWIEYPDIEALCIKIGAAPTDVKADGITPDYTLPVIYDPSTNKTISDSFAIALYLDTAYPDTPKLFPPGTQAIQEAFMQPAVFWKLPEGRSQEYFRRTREALYNVTIEEWTPRGDEKVKEWKRVERTLGVLAGHYRVAKEEFGILDAFLSGVKPTFGDFALAGILKWSEPNICWSPNTWKTRYSLNFKGLAYRTEWIEYPDIEALCIKIGAAPTDVKADGTSPEYTLPVIYDPSTNKAISDSFNIAQYLDTTYPDTPQLIPPGTRALQSGFTQYVNLRVKSILGQEALYNVKIEEWAPQGEDRAREWKRLRRALISLDGHYREAKEETGGILQWSKHILGAESEEWNDILSWQEGNWANFMSRLEGYAVVA